MADDKKARNRDISEGLLRQRRNLLLLSLLLPLFFISGADVKEINILGTIITVKNPSIVKASIGILFTYFLLRYWQYYKEETFVENMYRRLHEYLYRWEYDFLIKKAREKSSFLESGFVKVVFADPSYSIWEGRLAYIPENKNQVIFPFIRRCEFYIYPASVIEGHKIEDITVFNMTMAEHKNWEALLHGGTPYYREYLSYNIIRFNIMRFIGACKFMLNESYFTDYQLPFIVAACSGLATLYTAFI